MSVSFATEYPLLAQFQQFYAELVRVKSAVETGNWGALSKDEAGPGAESSDSESVGLVANRLAGFLEHQALEATKRGGDVGARLYREAQYVMAALADETCLHQMRWSAKDAWTSQLLERRLFGSYSAGEEIFQRARALLAKRDRIFTEIALIYFYALALGFQGKFRDRADREPIEALKRDLYQFVFRQAPNLADEARRASPGAYRHTQHGAQPRTLPYLRRWLEGLGAVAAILLVVSLWLWLDATWELADSLDWLADQR